MLGYLIAGTVSAVALYAGYRYMVKNKLVPAGNKPQGGSIAASGRQVGTVALPAGNDRVTMANNAIGGAAALAPAVISSINPNFKPTGTSPSNPSATGSQVAGNSVENTGILAGAQVAGALAPAGISALQKALTTTPTPTATVDPLSSNPSLSSQGFSGSQLGSNDWNYINDPANDAGGGLSPSDWNYIDNPANTDVGLGASINGPNYMDSDYYKANYGSTMIDSGYQSDYTGSTSYDTLDPTFSGSDTI